MDKNKSGILYLSHGKTTTGGYLHEKYMAERLSQVLSLPLTIKRYPRYFEGLFGHFQLLFKAFKDAKSDIIISVSRLSIPVILRNLLNNHPILLVWHYHDEQAKLSWFLKTWYTCSLFVIKQTSSSRCKVVVVAPFWKDYFSALLGEDKICYFPNFFNHYYYQTFKETPKKNQIHLGQVSFKNSDDIDWIAIQLKLHGYHCYMSTHDPEKLQQNNPNYEIKYFDTHEAYLTEMAASTYTLALPYFNEGWNRVAHESLLVGTDVIGYAKGGLGDLLTKAGALKAANREEVFRLIIEGIKVKQSALIEFDTSNDKMYLDEIIDWIKKTKMYKT